MSAEERTGHQLVSDMSALLQKPGAFDRARHWIHLQRLWSEPRTRTALVDIVHRYLTSFETVKRTPIMVVPETVSSPCGMVPVAFIVGHRLGLHIAVWKELGELQTGASKLLGGREAEGSTCFVLQDVVARGTTLERMLDDVAAVGWRVVAYYALVQNSREPEQVRTAFANLRGHDAVSDDFTFEFLVDAPSVLG